MRRAQALAVAVATLVVPGAVASCSTVLGFEDLTLDDADGGDSPDAPYDAGEAGPDADAALPDADAALPDADSALPDADADLPDVAEEADAPDDVVLDVEPDVQDAAQEEVSCGDTLTDPENCGRCDHSCVGGACDQGVCQPVDLVKISDGAWGMAVDDTSVYVAIQLNNEVSRISKTGTFLGTATGPSVAIPSWIAADSQNYYWSNRVTGTGSIAFCPLAGCVGNPGEIIDPSDRPNGVAADGTSVYWAETHGGTVKKAAPDGSNVEVLVADTLGYTPFLITLHGGNLYFSERTDGRVGRVPIGGGAVETMSITSEPSKIAVTDSWVYWTDGGTAGGGVFRVPNTTPPVDGHPPEIVAGGQNQPFGIVADAENVYWIASAYWITAEGALRYCPHAGCGGGGPISMDEGVPYPIDVVGDDQALYYSVYGIDGPLDGAIRKVAKP